MAAVAVVMEVSAVVMEVSAVVMEVSAVVMEVSAVVMEVSDSDMAAGRVLVVSVMTVWAFTTSGFSTTACTWMLCRFIPRRTGGVVFRTTMQTTTSTSGTKRQ